MAATTFLESVQVENELGEGVIWDARGGAFWWTDIDGRKIYRYQPADKLLESWVTPERLGCFAMVVDRDYLVCGFESGFAYFNPRNGAVQCLHKVDEDNKSTRLNDGRADRQGRFWAGSMVEDKQAGAPAGALYCLDGRLNFSSKVSGLSISNGLCWSPDSVFLYHTDTPTRRIDRYEFDENTASISNRTTFAQTANGCFPDGSTVDSAGYLWNAQWGGSQVIRYTPAGEVDLILPLPVSQPTCVAFGGPQLDRLIVTSARQGLGPQELAAQPEAGNVFIFQTDITGIVDPVYRPAVSSEALKQNG
ncbi:MAG: SMP-30/gluconolactonase/LRE family protein [Halioglobus sp.]